MDDFPRANRTMGDFHDAMAQRHAQEAQAASAPAFLRRDSDKEAKAIPAVRAIADMEHEADTLFDLLGTLIDRLQPVLEPQTPQTQPNVSLGAPSTVPLVASLEQHTSRLRNRNSMLRDVISRLAV